MTNIVQISPPDIAIGRYYIWGQVFPTLRGQKYGEMFGLHKENSLKIILDTVVFLTCKNAGFMW